MFVEFITFVPNFIWYKCSKSENNYHLLLFASLQKKDTRVFCDRLKIREKLEDKKKIEKLWLAMADPEQQPGTVEVNDAEESEEQKFSDFMSNPQVSWI